VQWLVDNFPDVPLLLIAFSRDDPSGGGSIYPAVWSAQLAARAHGVGSTMTALFREPTMAEAVMQRVGVPDGEGWRLSAAATFGYPLGRWGVAERQPPHTVTYRNYWDRPPGFTLERPLWSTASSEQL
jgi:nitroreductase